MGAPTCSDTSGEQVCPGFLPHLLGETTPDVTVEFPRRRRLRRPVRHSWICRPTIIQTLTPTTHRRCRSGLGNRSIKRWNRLKIQQSYSSKSQVQIVRVPYDSFHSECSRFSHSFQARSIFRTPIVQNWVVALFFNVGGRGGFWNSLSLFKI